MNALLEYGDGRVELKDVDMICPVLQFPEKWPNFQDALPWDLEYCGCAMCTGLRVRCFRYRDNVELSLGAIIHVYTETPGFIPGRPR